MKRLIKSFAIMVALVAPLAVAGVIPASAAPVSYSTTGLFTPGTGATAIPGGVSFTENSTTLDIVFTPQTTSVNTLVVADLGTLTVTLNGTGFVSIPQAPVPTTFAVTVNQTVPIVGSNTFTSTLKGGVSFNSGFLGVTFDNVSFNIGDTSYYLVNLTKGLPGIPDNTLLLDTTSTSGVKKVTALIATVPEPSAFFALATGFVGLAGVVLRKRLI